MTLTLATTTPGEPDSFQSFRVAVMGDSRGSYENFGNLLALADDTSTRLNAVTEALAREIANLGRQSGDLDAAALCPPGLRCAFDDPEALYGAYRDANGGADDGGLGSEGDPVVDLGDLVQGTAGVLGHERDAVVVGEDHDGPPPGDALAGVVGPVLHHLLGSDVERHAHREPPWVSAS